jgi:hypothetical protein
VAYAQRVVNSEREQFEKQHGVVIKTMVEREASPIRDEYAPVIFAQETLSYLESIDMMSGEVNNNTFEPLLCLLFRMCQVSHLRNAGGPREHYES